MAHSDTENTAQGFGTWVAARHNEAHKTTNFLLHKDRGGFEWNDAPLGLQELRHKVAVYSHGSYAHLIGHPVTLCIGDRGFSLQENLTTDEARLLAQALTLTADHADRAAAMAPSSEVAA
jgi:hypothetical protein